MMFTSNRSSALCDRLKQRYGNIQQDWQSLFKNQEKNSRDFEFIQYIVNFIIEQAKHNIVISELPDIIRTLHCQADVILRKNQMITLQEVIGQVQIAGAMKYPSLKKMKPISTEDFVKEVLREVFDRLGTVITLNMIENICRFTTCSAKQLLQAMPAIDVNEATTLIIEDISRNQRMRSEREPSRSTQKSKQLLSKTKLAEHNDLPISSSISHRSSKNINKNQQSRSSNQIGYEMFSDSTEQRLLKMKKSHNHFTQTIMENSFVTVRQHKSMKNSKSTDVLSSTFVPFDTCSTKKCSQIEIEQEMLNIKSDRTTKKSLVKNSLQEQTKNQKINLSRCKSNTQTYSIHSEEGLSAQTRKQNNTLVSNTNDNAFNKPTKSLNKISGNRLDLKEITSVRHYSKYCYQYSDLSDNEEQITEIDYEKCPLEDILNHRFIQ